MEYIVFLRLVMLTGIAQGRLLSSLPYDNARDLPSTVDILDNRHNEIMRNIHWNEASGLYQGDMVLTDEQKRAMVERKAIKDERYRWPKSADGTVNIDYRFGDTIVNRSIVALAMSRWQEATCVKFNEITAEVAKPHLIIVTHASACSSAVGQVYSQNGQNISLAAGCFNGGEATVVHELGHALGLQHEQSRSDRDDYLYIILGNVEAGMEFNFNKEDTNNYGLAYDYTSIMQYTATAFSKNGLNTIVAKDPLAQPLLTDILFLSFMDKKIVNLMYNCTDTWLAKCNLTATPCKNQGYTKSNCTCECPAGTSGANCENLHQPYIDALVYAKSPGSKRITTEGTVTSPGFPAPVTTATSRVQSIVAPACHKVKLTFNVFDMEGLSQFTSSTGVITNECWFMILEIRLDDPPITGTKYCGANITANQTFESVGQSMVLTFSTTNVLPVNLNTGYNATVKFVPVITGNCTPTTTPTATNTTTPTTTPTTANTTTPTTANTTTPTTANTTTPTTANTTTPTTANTTTPTTTLTTANTTTPTTTPTTAAPSPGRFINSGCLPLTPSMSMGQCRLMPTLFPSVNFYSSPNFPGKYDMSQQCMIWFNTTEPRYLKVTPWILNLGPSDSVGLSSAYQNTTYLKMGTTITLPTSSSKLTFQASPSSPRGSFFILVEVANSRCHQLIELAACSTGPLSIPANYPPGTVCEWWLRAPAGRKVQVSFSNFSIGVSTCLRDSVVISLTGDNKYETGSTRYSGGNETSPGTVVSIGNALNILVNGQFGNYMGLQATYKVV